MGRLRWIQEEKILLIYVRISLANAFIFHFLISLYTSLRKINLLLFKFFRECVNVHFNARSYIFIGVYIYTRCDTLLLKEIIEYSIWHRIWNSMSLLISTYKVAGKICLINFLKINLKPLWIKSSKNSRNVTHWLLLKAPGQKTTVPLLHLLQRWYLHGWIQGVAAPYKKSSISKT